MVNNYYCIECGYKWTSRKLFGNPAICHSCKSNKIQSIGVSSLKGIFSYLWGDEEKVVEH